MNVGKAGWLETLLRDAVRTHAPPDADPQLESLRPRARARAYLRHLVRASGLRYGTPATPNAELPQPAAPEERLFIAVLRTLAELGLLVADWTQAPRGPRAEQLTVLFAALTGELELAQQVERALRKDKSVPRKLALKVETALSQRAMSLSGDPVYGLVLHNGAVYVDAQVFGHQASEYFLRGELVRKNAERRLALAGREKAVLVEVLTALACAERSPSFSAQRAILRQIEDLRLGDKPTAALKERVQRAFERKPRLKSIVKAVRSRDGRQFLVEQTVLASLVDGRRSPTELAFLQELARVMNVGPEEVKQVEVQVAEFYARNRSVVDVFTVSAGAGLMGEELVAGMQRTMQKNFQRLLREVRETGELSVLLAKAARGQKLSPEEKKKMRAQLLDVAKAIPALAIFAAPGGLLLLVALAKVLPFNILPSAFQDEPLEPEPVTDPGLTPRRSSGSIPAVRSTR